MSRFTLPVQIVLASSLAIGMLALAAVHIFAAFDTLERRLTEREHAFRAALASSKTEGQSRAHWRECNPDFAEKDQRFAHQPRGLIAASKNPEAARAAAIEAKPATLADASHRQDRCGEIAQAFGISHRGMGSGLPMERSLEEARWSIAANLTLTAVFTAAIAVGFASAVRRRWKPVTEACEQRERGKRLEMPGNDEAATVAAWLNRISDQLRMQERALEEFVTVIARELRSLLTAANAALERLDGAGVLEQKAVVVQLGENLKKELAFLDKLTTAAQAQSGSLTLSRSNVDLYTLVDSVVRALQPAVDSRSQRITIKDPGHAIVLSLDEKRMRQVLENVIGNAAKFTGEGGRITVALNDLATDVTISVRDSGIGIAPEKLSRVLKKVSPLDAAGGHGLGLFIADHIVKVHGGQITAESQPGLGTRFTIRLPKDSE